MVGAQLSSLLSVNSWRTVVTIWFGRRRSIWGKPTATIVCLIRFTTRQSMTCSAQKTGKNFTLPFLIGSAHREMTGRFFFIFSPGSRRQSCSLHLGIPGNRLGVAVLFVEIPLIQRFILILGHPTYAFTVVVLALLSFSGLGSLLVRAAWLPRRAALILLVVLTLLTSWAVMNLSDALLGWEIPWRALAAVIGLAPLAILMGLPFPLGLTWLEGDAPDLAAWAWAVNGCASVIASR